MRHYCLTFIILAGLLATACGNPQNLAIKKGAKDFNCPEDEVKADWIDVRTYRVDGCSSTGVYTCSTLKKKCKRDTHDTFWD